MPSDRSSAQPTATLDLFCRVIDNHGDLGVCWRLARDLAARGLSVRLWVDDATALAWMAPGAEQGRWPGITLHAWTDASQPRVLAALAPASVWIEAFGCELPAPFIAARAAQVAQGAASVPVWINLEYLSAEGYVERSHGLPSPIAFGPAAGWVKWFFYPGFTPRTGGLLRELALGAEHAAFDAGTAAGAATPAPWHDADAPGTLRVSLFCYEPPALAATLARWATEGDAHAPPLRLYVAPGRPAAAVAQALATAAHAPGDSPFSDQIGLRPWSTRKTLLLISYYPAVEQAHFDRLLWSCALNLVRGEDSLVRALWAGAPFIWQIYPQDDNAHHAKLHAFLDWLHAPASLRQAHAVWNGLRPGALPRPTPSLLAEWRACAQAARARLLQQDDLTTQLLAFIAAKARGPTHGAGPAQ